MTLAERFTLRRLGPGRTRPRSAVAVLALALAGLLGTGAVGAAAPAGMATPTAGGSAADARGQLVAGDRRLSVTDIPLSAGGVERRFAEGAAVLYRSHIRPTADGLEVEVLDGHPSQLGRLRVTGGQLSVESLDGRALWREALAEPLCLPELLGEFVRAHWDRLAPGSPALRCGTPILKAGKVAPVQFTRLPDLPDGRRVVEFGPGSLGMRLFLVPTRLTFSADGRRLLAHDGQFEAPRSVEGRASYLRGSATWPGGRALADWPALRVGSAATSRGEAWAGTRSPAP